MSGKRRFDAVDPIVTALMTKITGAAALHVLLMRLALAQDAYDVFGWKADMVFTMADVSSRFRELLRCLDSDDWKQRSRAVRTLLFPLLIGAFGRLRWASQIVLSRLAVMDMQSDDDTDTEA